MILTIKIQVTNRFNIPAEWKTKTSGSLLLRVNKIIEVAERFVESGQDIEAEAGDPVMGQLYDCAKVFGQLISQGARPSGTYIGSIIIDMTCKHIHAIDELKVAFYRPGGLQMCLNEALATVAQPYGIDRLLFDITLDEAEIEAAKKALLATAGKI
jgi:hypothetical protein